MKCMHMMSRNRDHSEGRGLGVNGGLEPFRKFIRFLAWPVPNSLQQRRQENWNVGENIYCILGKIYFAYWGRYILHTGENMLRYFCILGKICFAYWENMFHNSKKDRPVKSLNMIQIGNQQHFR